MNKAFSRFLFLFAVLSSAGLAAQEECETQAFYYEDPTVGYEDCQYRPRRYLFCIRTYPYNPEERRLIEERRGAHWPGKREGDFYDRMTR